jgi:predicted metal-binding protein
VSTVGGGCSETAERDLDRIGKVLRENGADETVVIAATDVLVDDRVRLKCQVPLCDSYGRNYTCPPHVPPVSEVRAALARYETGLLVRVSDVLEGEKGDPFRAARRLHELIHLGEKEAFSIGYRFAMGFIGGCCRLCETCAAVTGEACRFPFLARPSMESMGIDVAGTAERAGISISFPVRDKVSWIGLLLVC